MTNRLRWCLAATLLMAGSSITAQAQTKLRGRSWRLISVGEMNVVKTPGAPEAMVTFELDGKRVSGSTGCNRLMGGYQVKGQVLRFTPGGLTRMACPEPLMRQENLLLEALRATRSYRIASGKLELLDGDRSLATFAASDAQPPKPTVVPFEKWMGKWVGPEGTSLLLAKKGDAYSVRIRSLDGVRTFVGRAQQDTIVFTRDGKQESIRAGSGTDTGMKWLLQKKNCLVIRTGEGFCRD